MPVAIAEDIFDYTKQPNSDIVVPVRRFTFSDESKAIRIQVNYKSRRPNVIQQYREYNNIGRLTATHKYCM